MKKGQTEIIGLVIIMMLIVFIGLIALKFMSFGNNDDLKDTSLSIKANNLVNALTKVDIDGVSLKNNAVKCCNEGCNVNFEDEIKNIMNKSLEGDYSLIISEENGQECAKIGICNAGISSSKYFIRDEGDKFSINLLLCN